MKRSADAVDASSAPPPRASHTLRATAPQFVPQQQPLPPPPPPPPPPSQNPPQKMRRTDAPQAQAFGEARRRAHEQAVREEAEYQAWRAAELAAADDQPDDEEQVCGLTSTRLGCYACIYTRWPSLKRWEAAQQDPLRDQ